MGLSEVVKPRGEVGWRGPPPDGRKITLSLGTALLHMVFISANRSQKLPGQLLYLKSMLLTPLLLDFFFFFLYHYFTTGWIVQSCWQRDVGAFIFYPRSGPVQPLLAMRETQELSAESWREKEGALCLYLRSTHRGRWGLDAKRPDNKWIPPACHKIAEPWENDRTFFLQALTSL